MNANKLKLWVRLGAALMGLAVIIGAFGAHGLKPLLSDYQLDIYNKGVLYHMIHALGILIAAALSNSVYVRTKFLNLACYFLLIGCILFSGSLYLLATKEVFIAFPDALGIVTPFGGLSFIVGWLFLALSIKKS